MRFLITVFMVITVSFAFGQAGNLDLTFNNYMYDHFGNGTGFYYDSGAGTYVEITDAIEQPDCMLLICGHFSSYNGFPRTGLVRTFPDGKIDTSFVPAFADDVETIALQPDGKILIGGGAFASYSGIRRLNADGSL